MTRRMPHLVQALGATVWAMQPDKLAAVIEVLSHRLMGERLSPEERADRLEPFAADRAPASAPSGGAIAVLPLAGIIGHRMQMVQDISAPGGSSTEAFGQMFDAAMADPNVRAIVLDISSPGGTVFGVPELAARIAAARGEKKVVAVANALAASAAYWIGAAADEFVVIPSGQVGSIGVYGTHVDQSAYDANEGVKVTFISAGKYKVEGNMHEPLDDEARAAMQDQVDEYYDDFVNAVAKYRGTTAKAVRGGYGEGRVLTARQALSAGLVDRIGTMDDTLARLTKRSGTAAKRPAALASMGLAASLTDTTGTGTFNVSLVPSTVSTGPASGDAPRINLIPIEPAPAAKEHDMPENVTTAAVAEGGAANAGAASPPQSASQSVAVALSQLAAEHGFADRTSELLQAASTVEAGSKMVLGWIREKAAQTPHVHSAEGRTPVVTGGRPRGVDRPFGSLGEQLLAIKDSYSPGGRVDERLFAAASGNNQGVPSEGGFLVAPEFAPEIQDPLAADPNNLLAMTDNYPVTGESLTFNANGETSRATGSRFGGVQGYWIKEADQITKSKPKFREAKVEPQEMAVLLYATDKLLRNAPALAQWFSRAASEEIAFMCGDAIVNGSGVGKPLGLLNSGSLITVAKETSQANDTIQQENISKMWARLHPRARQNAIWLHNVDVEPQLDALSTVVKNVAGTENVGGYANKVFDSERRTLKGRPLVASEFCGTLGDVGDLILADLGAYLTGTAVAGLLNAMSIHVRFEYAETCFRTMFALDGQPWLGSALTPYKGSNTLSTHIALAAR